MKRLAALTTLFVLGSVPARAAQVDASGYVKNLYQHTRSRLGARPYWLDLTRARLSLDAKAPLVAAESEWEEPPVSLRFHVDYDHELRTGTFFKSRDYQAFGLTEPPSHFPMEAVISTGTDGHYRHRLYRGWVEATALGAHLRFGRQRIAWGTGKLWNPTDILNPYSPTTLERDERRGVDAVYLRRGMGIYGQGEAVYAIGGNWAETDLLARAKGHILSTDFSFLGGKVAGSTGSWTIGGDVATDVYGGNLHGEWSHTELRLREPFWKVLVGYEYSFSAEPFWAPLKDVWLVFEYFRNGIGSSDSARYEPGLILSGREVTLGRDYTGFGFKKDVTPLVTFEYYEVVNWNDRSYFINPSISWNVVENLHLLAGIQGFGGKPNTEYGPNANVTYFQAQYFF